jgi:adenylate cyclase
MKYKRFLALSLVAVASTGLALGADAIGGLTGIEGLRYKTLDWRQRTTFQSFQPGRGTRESDITLVMFNAYSVTDSVDGWPYEQPFPRDYIARVVDAVSAAGARTIGLDVYLQLRYPKLNEIYHGDELLHDAIERAGNVVLVGPIVQTDQGPELGMPDPYFADVAAAVGAAELPTAFETIREAPLAVRAGGRLVPSFSLALYANAEGFDADSLLRDTRESGRIALPGLPLQYGRVPGDWRDGGASAANTLLLFPIHYIGPPSSADADDPPGTFPAVASSTVELTAMFQPELFKDKIVLIGSGFHDSDKFRTPFFQMEAPPEYVAQHGPKQYEWMYGVEVHANALQDMLDGAYVRPLSGRAQLLLTLVLAFAVGGLVFRRGAGWGGGTGILILSGLVVTGYWAWAGKAYGPGGDWFALGAPYLWFPVVVPALAAILSYVGSVAWVSVVEGREKRYIKNAFAKYVSPEVVAEIAENPAMLQLGGQKRPLTLLFSDLAGFTSMSEKMDPQDLLAHLNEYLQAMTEIVLDEGGTLDKYIGDAIMAFWNAPKDAADHADRALRTAILMQRRMGTLNAKWREADPDAKDLVVRIGINTGLVVVGNMGGEDTFNYSAVGDSVNLAARLEPANKSYDTLVMASEFTLDAARREAFRYRELDLIAVKGKVEPVKVFEILELADMAFSPQREEALRRYEAGLAAYKSRNWGAAAAHFRAAVEADPTDGPSRVYLERAEEYVNDPPPADWDFVVRRTVK